jgi:hypothetical protein
MLICDACSNGYHLHCLAPPLLRPPRGRWYCPTCWHPGGHRDGICYCEQPPSDTWRPPNTVLARCPAAEQAWERARLLRKWPKHPPGYTPRAQRPPAPPVPRPAPPPGGGGPGAAGRGYGGAAISVEFDAELFALPFDAPKDAAFATAALAVSAELDVKTPAAGAGPPPTPGGAPACGAEAAVAAVTRQRLPSGFPLLPADDEGPALPPALPPTARAAAAAPDEGGEPAPAGPLPQPAPTAPAQRLRFRALKNAVRQAKAVLASLGTLTDGAQALMEHPEAGAWAAGGHGPGWTPGGCKPLWAGCGRRGG